VAAAALLLPAAADGGSAQTLAERVSFASLDQRTTLIGYLFAPREPRDTRSPAVVMMHGRAGAYSSQARGRYDAATLSARHRMWGELWAAQGYLALLVDGFGPRGYAHGFPRFSYQERPPEVDEVTVRPLDAYGALAYLRRREDVALDRVGLMGWSNGGSATLATMAAVAPAGVSETPGAGFRAALAFYPGCGLKGRFEDGLIPYAPVRVFMGLADEEVSPDVCRRLVDRSRGKGGDIEIRFYRGAEHSFDSPTSNRQRVADNAHAKADSMARALRFFAERLGK
jgi:carboxymethylenebutenolidase